MSKDPLFILSLLHLLPSGILTSILATLMLFLIWFKFTVDHFYVFKSIFKSTEQFLNQLDFFHY